MLQPFSKRTLRQLAGVSQEALLDPWQLAPKVGLRAMDGETEVSIAS
jgi:hypothetical protein